MNGYIAIIVIVTKSGTVTLTNTVSSSFLLLVYLDTSQYLFSISIELVYFISSRQFFCSRLNEVLKQVPASPVKQTKR